MLEHVQHQVPVTALAFLNDDVILSGEGHLVRAYNVNTIARLGSVSVFKDQQIHGIIPQDENTCLVWGGWSFCTLKSVASGSSDTSSFEADKPSQTTDWILDAAYSPRDHAPQQRLAAFVTAHNALALAPVSALHKSGKSPGEEKIEPLIPGANCILYSAHIHWLSPSQCLIASGTAFGDVIVWSACISRAQDGTLSAKAQTHYTFSAHEGSVFGVQISETLQDGVLGNCSRALATCSDDRTVKLWDISDLSTDSPTLMQLQRDTGFGAKHEVEEHGPLLLAKVMGHVSRIWHVRFQPHGDTGALQILSFGEDASDILWAVRPTTASISSSLPYTLEQVQFTSPHAGKHIWSVAIPSHHRVITGGADGAIALRPSTSCSKPQRVANQILLDRSNEKDSIKAYGFVAEGTLLATTEQGRVVLLDLVNSAGASTREVAPVTSGLRGYSLVSSVSGTAFVAGADGTVRIYSQEHRRLLEIYSTGRKTAGLFAHSSSRNGDQDIIYVLVTSVGNESATLLQINIGVVFSNPDLVPTAQVQWPLSLPEAFIVTSFIIMRTDDRTVAVLGSRNGTIALYNLDGPKAESPLIVWHLLPEAHAKEAVTSLLWMPTGTPSESLVGHLHSVGRDGTHAVHRVSARDQAWRSELVHHLSLPFGPNIHGLLYSTDGRILIWGFRSKHFVVYDLTNQREIMSVECGGAHRNWAFHPCESGGTLVWTKASKVYQQSQTRLPYLLVNSGGHGREIKAVAVSRTKPQIAATGAEDTNIKLWTFDERQGFRCLQTVRKHNTGIQHLQWSQDGNFFFSSGGFEEFFVWRVTTDVPDMEIGVVCESAHPKSGTSDLRIMSFDVTNSHPSTNSDYIVTIAYSDSSLKRWRFRTDDGHWSLQTSGDYLTFCLTHVVSNRDDGTHLLTAATDGHVAAWDTDVVMSPLRWSTRHKVHQSAILSFSSLKLADGSGLVITGGDDNAIGLTRIAGTGTMQTLLLRGAHAAAVTGLAVVRRDAHRLLLASASIDQRLKLWQVDIDCDRLGMDGVSVRRLEDAFTPVADVSSLATYELEGGGIGLLICGVGMDIWRVV